MSNPVTYKTDKAGDEIYPKDFTNKPYLVEGRYARDNDGVPFYPRDLNNNEFMDPGLGLIRRYGKYDTLGTYPRMNYVYPRYYVNGKPNYRKDPTKPNRQIYEKINDEWVIGTGLDGDQYYAVNEHNNEYYPSDNTPARKSNRRIKYAFDRYKAIIFPVDENNNQFYLTSVDPSDPDTIPHKYAISGNDEIYPQTRISGIIRDYIIGEQYAKRAVTTANPRQYYPMDVYNNEFYLSSTNRAGQYRKPEDRILANYAVTNDGKIIIPDFGPKPNVRKRQKYYIDPNMKPIIKDENVLGRLAREHYKVSPDFLTNVEVLIKPNVEYRAYRYLNEKTNIFKTITPPGVELIPPSLTTNEPLPPTLFYKTWYFWILIIILSIINPFNIWSFLRKKELYLTNESN